MLVQGRGNAVIRNSRRMSVTVGWTRGKAVGGSSS